MNPHADLERKLAFLKEPAAYPENNASVRAVETHMAWIFLTRRYAYKLKKPVRLAFLDFSTIEHRKRDCELEVALNRRLTDGVYLGTIPLTLDRSDRLELGGKGSAVDWLVWMRRLPQEMMLDERIRRGTVTEEEIHRTAVLLADFYRRSGPEGADGPAYLERIRQDHQENCVALQEPRYRLDRSLVDRVCAAQFDRLRWSKELLAGRADSKRIVEGHGDLRPEHICLEATPVVFDCLEFNRTFRILDPADELSFLSMECDRLGAEYVGDSLFKVYSSVTNDDPPEPLIPFYKARRALLRAKLAVWHLDDEGIDVTKWRAAAEGYLNLAEAYQREMHGRVD